MDPMVGSGSGGKRSHAHNSIVGGVHPEEENSNSNVVSLLEVCWFCNRRFLYDLTLDPATNHDDDHGLKEEDILLHMFFEDTSALEKSLLQCCTFCKATCHSLMEAKSALSNIIDEVTTLLRKSKKLSSSALYMLSKPRVVTRLFQEHHPSSSSSYLVGNLGNLSSTIQIQLDTEYNNSSSGFQSQFIQLNSIGGSLGESPTSKFPRSIIPIIEHLGSGNGTGTGSIMKEITPTPSFSFLSPSKSICGRNNKTPEKPEPKSLPKPTSKRKQTSGTLSTSKNDASPTGTTTTSTIPNKRSLMVANSSGRFVLVQEHISNMEENARDVEDLNDNANSDIQQLAHQASSVIPDQHQKYILLGLEEPETCHVQDQIASSVEHDHDESYAEQVTFPSSEEEKVHRYPESENNLRNLANKKPGGKFTCNICVKTFKCKRDLESHIGSHSKSKPYTCEICGSSYRQKKALNIHVGIHNGESKFECNHCKKVFTQKVSLLRHLPMHTGETVYQCDLCGKGFLHHSSFAHHKLTHSGQRKFQCEVCDNEFFTSSHLKRHCRTHTGEKPFQCNICDKSFNEKSNLKVHQRVHTKIPAFQCSECSKGFDRKHKLRTHLQTEHSQWLQLQEEEIAGY